MSINRRITSSSGEVFIITKRNMNSSARVTIFLRKPKINNEEFVAMTSNSHQKIVWLNVLKETKVYKILWKNTRCMKFLTCIYSIRPIIWSANIKTVWNKMLQNYSDKLNNKDGTIKIKKLDRIRDQNIWFNQRPYPKRKAPSFFSLLFITQ